jgi:predicted O-linked N-acetylglucosamine transferase (SPINDLY family)
MKGQHMSLSQDQVGALNQLLQQAAGLLDAGQLPQAEACCQQVLAVIPVQADALHILGLAALRRGQAEAAVSFITRAVQAAPAPTPFMYLNRGSALQMAGQLQAALQDYRQAVALMPELVMAHANMAVVLETLGDLAAAALSYRRVLELAPAAADICCRLAAVLQALGQAGEAETLFRRAMALQPQHPDALCGLAALLQQQGRAGEALALCRLALQLPSPTAVLLMNVGAVLLLLGQLEDGLAVSRRALALDPDLLNACNNIGSMLVGEGRLVEAEACYREALLRHPQWALGQFNLGNILRAMNLPAAAEAAYRVVLALDPQWAAAWCNLGSACGDQGRLEEAVAAYRRALAMQPGWAEPQSNLLLTLQYMSTISPAAIFAEQRGYAAWLEAPLKEHWPAHANAPDPQRRLRIGYVSADFRRHPVANFFEPVLASHDHSQFEIFCYYNNSIRDEVSLRLEQQADHWCVCAGMTNEQMAARIQADGIDILFDLSGYSAGNRLPVFARKPAPVQVTWIGYPGTTGLSAMDYRLTDAWLDPPGLTECYHSEQLVRLTGSATFRPADSSPAVNPLPALGSGAVTLACLNSLIKVNPQVIAVWARILARLPGARLMLGNVSEPGMVQRMQAMFADAGVAAERLILMPNLPLQDYLALHHRIDLALDPFPYGGGTSTYHSLWMGVPVITLAGASAPARQGAAILGGLGLTECIAESEDAYVERVLALLADLPALERLRQSLRQRLEATVALGAGPLTRSLEQALRQMWQHWCRR